MNRLSSPLTAPTAPATPKGGACPAEGSLDARLDEILGLVRIPGLDTAVDAGSPEAMTRLAFHLADALERTQRQLIESNIQLMSLREVTTNLLSLHSLEKAAETIALYLHKAFDYERVAVLLREGETDTLNGWVSARDGGRVVSEPLELPLAGATGVLPGVLASGDSRLLADGDAAPLYEGPRALPAVFAGRRLNSSLVIPLRTAAGDAVLGLLLVGRSDPSPPLGGSDLLLLDSMGATVSTVVENARLYQDVQRGERFRDDILNSMATGLVAIGLDGRVTMMNQSAVQLTGYGRDEVEGERPPFLPGDDDNAAKLIGQALAGRPFVRRDVTLRRKDGTDFPASLTTSPLLDERRGVRGAIATFLDLTEIRKMEERIRQLDRLAVLGRFTAAIAHEIRNPLTGISTGVQYLSRSLPETGRENAGFILAEVQRLNRIVEDLFRVTHPHPLHTSPVDLGGLLDRSLKSLNGLPGEGGVRVNCQFATEVPPVPLDADQLQQVAINLIKNALEATPAGGQVTLRTGTRPGRAGEPDWAWFRVIDTGTGMSPETLKSIFEPFFTKKQSGTGLGLYITHGIVERHGGHLKVESTEGQGSQFTVELPLRAPSHGGTA